MQFDVHRNQGDDRDTIRYFITLQDDSLNGLQSCVVAPLKAVRTFRAHSRLQPEFEIDGHPAVLVTNELLAIDVRDLGPFVGNLAAECDRVIAALDFLFTGV